MAAGQEALPWFTQTGAQNGFTFESSTDWSRLSGDLSAYQVVCVQLVQYAGNGTGAQSFRLR
jgi:hypothetical protein